MEPKPDAEDVVFGIGNEAGMNASKLAAGEKVCGARTVFWPDDECIDVECVLAADHSGPHDDGMFDWNDDDMMTTYPND